MEIYMSAILLESFWKPLSENKIKEVTEKPATKPSNRKIENNDEMVPIKATNWDYGQ